VLGPGARQGWWKPYLHHISKGTSKQRRVVKLPVTARITRLRAASEVQSILDSCEHLRDRLLFALLHDAGFRIGEALGLRHEDIAVAEREITVRRRDSTNGARAKSPHPQVDETNAVSTKGTSRLPVDLSSAPRP
jgi:integrase/recombinase XerD